MTYWQRDTSGSFNPPLKNGEWVCVEPPPTLLERAFGPVACAGLLAAIIAAGALMFAAIIYWPGR